MAIEEEIRDILLHAFKPSALEIKNESWRHKGHAEAGDAQETHYSVHIVSEEFEGKSRIEVHKLVYGQLSDVMSRIHSLKIRASSPAAVR